MSRHRTIRLTLALLALGTVPCAAQARTVRIASKILGEERVVHVRLPANHEVARQKYHVTYLLDGHVRQFFDVTVAAAAYDLTGSPHDYAMPPQIIVGVDHRDRGTDLGRNQELFTKFLAEELVPFIDREYRTTRYRTLIGHSLGGRFALMSFCRAPEVFAGVIAISPSVGDSAAPAALTRCLASAFASSSTALRQVVISAGEREQRIQTAANQLRDYLRANAPPHWRWTMMDLPALGHVETPQATIPPALRFLFDKSVWELPPSLADSVTMGLIDPDQAITAFGVDLKTRTGVAMPASLKWMLVTARLRMRQPDARAADQAVRRLIDAYPEDLEGYGYLSELALRRNDDAGARRALEDARRMLGRLQMHDVYERERKVKLIDDALSSIRP